MIRELDLQQEYLKLERMVCEESYLARHQTLNNAIEQGFRNWIHRDNYTSFSELRKAIGLNIGINQADTLTTYRTNINENDFFHYCEMLMNLFPVANGSTYSFDQQVHHVVETMNADLAKLNHKFSTIDGKCLIVQCDAAASSAVEHVPLKVGQAIIQYNHYFLRGNIEKKRILLKIIADELEPKSKHLKQLNKHVEDTLSFLFNNMHIRHNNRDAGDKQKYNPVLVKLSNNEVEAWYDDTYQLALYAILLMDNDIRMKKVDLLKQTMIETGSCRIFFPLNSAVWNYIW